MQGDVIAIVDKDAQTVAKYSYDAWGKILSTTNATGTDISGIPSHIANINPFRYRGYYFDEEIGMFYLQSRYYDAGVGRFANGDHVSYTGKSGTVLGTDLYSYCENNAICRTDTFGAFWLTLIVASVTLAYLGNNLIHSVYNQANTPSGFIYNQTTGKVANLKFGFFKSSHNGCGWIATYNALLLLGKKPKAEKIISEYELTGAVLYGAFGIQPYAITHYFRFRGYKVTVTYNSNNFDKTAKKNTANIIWYWHKSGAHYVALQWNGKKFIGYNTYTNSTGPDDWGNSISATLNSKGWTATLLISISNK